MEINTLIGYLLTPITGVVGWLAATRTRRIDSLKHMQSAIDEIVEKNKQYTSEIIKLRDDYKKSLQTNMDLIVEIKAVRKENAELKDGQKRLEEQLKKLNSENKELKKLLKQK